MLNKTLWGNTIETWLIALGISVGLLLAVKLIRDLLVRRFFKLDQSRTDDINALIAAMVKSVSMPIVALLFFYVGLKTTRIRSLSGEQLVFSNSDLLKSRIRNYKRMAERRVVFSIGVVYQTDYDTQKKIPDSIRKNLPQIRHILLAIPQRPNRKLKLHPGFVRSDP